MQKKIPAFITEMRQINGAHVFYLTKQKHLYIENVLIFILDGIQKKDQVLVVENKRLMPLILARLDSMVTKEELKGVHFFDSYDLYWHKGDFLPSTIVEYFKETAEPSLDEGKCYRTWGHIEWGTEAGLEEELLSYESKINQLISEHKLVAVCAYDATRVAEHLQEKLGRYHNVLMKDDSIISLTRCLNKKKMEAVGSDTGQNNNQR